LPLCWNYSCCFYYHLIFTLCIYLLYLFILFLTPEYSRYSVGNLMLDLSFLCSVCRSLFIILTFFSFTIILCVFLPINRLVINFASLLELFMLFLLSPYFYSLYLFVVFIHFISYVMTNIGFKRLQYSPKYQTFTSIQVWRNINGYK
jgi:hypothetical protein